MGVYAEQGMGFSMRNHLGFFLLLLLLLFFYWDKIGLQEVDVREKFYVNIPFANALLNKQFYMIYVCKHPFLFSVETFA